MAEEPIRAAPTEAQLTRQLAEDRFLCFELTAARGHKWRLAYVRAAKGTTDVPESAVDFIGQRRRWLNGSLAATLYSLTHFGQLFGTRHSYLRLAVLLFKAAYDVFVLLFLWLCPAASWLTFTIILDRVVFSARVYIFGSAEATWWVNTVAIWTFGGLLAMQVVVALGGRPKGARRLYGLTFAIFAVLTYYLLANALILAYKLAQAATFDFSPRESVGARLLQIISSEAVLLGGALLSTFGAYVISALLFRDVAHIFTCFIQYLGFAMSFLLVLTIYAFSNVSDVSWGTKGLEKADLLPSMRSKPTAAGAEVVEDVEKTPADLSLSFKDTVLRTLAPHREKPDDRTLSEDDQNRKFRTHLLLAWLGTNALVIAAINHLGGFQHRTTDVVVEQRQSIFFRVVLYSMTLVSLTQLIGAVYFAVRFELIGGLLGCCRRR